MAKILAGFLRIWGGFVVAANRLWQILSLGERIAVIGLLVVALIFAILYLRDRRLPFRPEPDFGGQYTEGVLVSGEAEVQELGRLTSAGLLKFTPEGELEGDLAEKWEISEDGKVYRFSIKSQIQAESLVEAAKNGSANLPKLQVKSTDKNELEFTLEQPYGPFLSAMTAAVYPYGPYEIIKKSDSEVKLKPRKDFLGSIPYISQITLRYYRSEDELKTALKNKEINGIVGGEIIAGKFVDQSFEVPREVMIFINLRRDRFADRAFRQKITSSEGSLEGEKFDLVSPLSSEYDGYLAQTIEQLQKQGAQVNLIRKEQANLIKENLMPREYDLLLFGIDYGTDYDPYPFWHSSQAKSPGNNFSGFKNFTVDKLLEEARLSADRQTRADRYREFSRILNEEAPARIFPRKKINYQVSGSVKNINIYSAVVPTDRFLNVNEWYIKVKRIKT